MGGERGSRGRIIVFGILFWYPLAGVTYQFLHYLMGLRRLGYDPYYVEDSGRWVYDPGLNDLSPDASRNVAAVAPVLEAHGFGDRWAFRGNYPDGRCYGLEEAQILQLYREADAFLNVTGAQEIREEHLACRRRIYVESDPFASQVKMAAGDAATIAALEAHDTLFTFGENIGANDCDIPVGRFTLAAHAAARRAEPLAGGAAGGRRAVHRPSPRGTTRARTSHTTAIGTTGRRTASSRSSWTSHRGAPRSPSSWRPGWTPPCGARLVGHGWRQRDSIEISTHLERYRDYIRLARGEFTVARDQYVRPRTGWFSDRTVCYLAAGRPVITQETGFSTFVPPGRGLFGFTTMDDILAAVDAIESDYEGHCRAARELAAEYFSAEKVVGSLMARAGL